MKFRVTMKDPDGVFESLRDAATASLKGTEGLGDMERDDLIEKRREGFGFHIKPWFEYGEYLTVEIDTDAKTCVVVQNKGR